MNILQYFVGQRFRCRLCDWDQAARQWHYQYTGHSGRFLGVGLPESEQGCQGVGVLLSSRLVSSAVEYKVINPRLHWVHFNLKITRVFLLAAYAPVSSAPWDELEEFWESVRDDLGSQKQWKINNMWWLGRMGRNCAQRLRGSARSVW